jgi:type IV secretion system protein VirD4
VFAMAALLHAAALLGEDMSAVWRWSQLFGDPIREALACPGASPELLAAAAEIQRDGKSADSIRMTMARSLAWVGVPALRRTVSGKGIRPFSAAQWIGGNATLYVLNSGELSAAAPLFRAVVEKVHRDCVLAGSLTPYGRIPNPVGFFLDEVTQTAAVPLADWLATSAGSGIQVCYITHTPAQLRARYGKDTAEAIWALSGTKIVLGGNTDAEMAEAISKLCGFYGGEMADPVVPIAYIRQLPESRALILAMNRSPLTVKVRPVWRRLSFRLRLNPAPYVPLPGPVALPGLTHGAEGEAA